MTMSERGRIPAAVTEQHETAAKNL